MIYLNSNAIWILDSEANQTKPNQTYLHLLHVLHQPSKFMESLFRGATQMLPPWAGEKAGEGDLFSLYKALHAWQVPPKLTGTRQGWAVPRRAAQACSSGTTGVGKQGGAMCLLPYFHGMLIWTHITWEPEQPLHSRLRSICFTFSSKGRRWQIRGNSIFMQYNRAQITANSRRQIRLLDPVLAMVLSRSGALWNFVLLQDCGIKYLIQY